jgi:hypothetical protein
LRICRSPARHWSQPQVVRRCTCRAEGSELQQHALPRTLPSGRYVTCFRRIGEQLGVAGGPLNHRRPYRNARGRPQSRLLPRGVGRCPRQD